MKKLILLSVLFASLTTTAMAADKVGDLCPQTGFTSSTNNGEVLSCVEGKWEYIGQVGITQVSLSVKILDGAKVVSDAWLTTLDGLPVPYSVELTHTYTDGVKKEGNKVIPTTGRLTTELNMMLRPVVTEDGKIILSFSLKLSELVCMYTMKQYGIKIEKPEVSIVEMKQNIMLKIGKEVAVPFGPMTEPMQTTGMPPMVMAAAHPRYTLKIVATKN